MHWTQYLGALSSGAGVTARIAFASPLPGAALAFAADIARAAGRPVGNLIAFVYIEFLCATSRLVQLFRLFYALPLIGPSLTATETGIPGLGRNTGAYVAEVVRGAILAVRRAQHETAVALNFSRRHTLWRILLPQAIPEMIPPLGNLAVQNLKDTALVSMITISDLTFHAQALRNPERVPVD